MKTKTGACPHCGAPIYAPTFWHGITPPPNEFTCTCTAHLRKSTVDTSSNIRIDRKLVIDFTGSH